MVYFTENYPFRQLAKMRQLPQAETSKLRNVYHIRDCFCPQFVQLNIIITIIIIAVIIVVVFIITAVVVWYVNPAFRAAIHVDNNGPES